jgi:hypothetical protein
MAKDKLQGRYREEVAVELETVQRDNLGLAKGRYICLDALPSKEGIPNAKVF